MAGVNKVILIGNLGSAPEVKTTAGGQQVANFSLATSEVYVDKGGQKQEKTEWHRIVLWGKQAELAGRYLQKGSQIYLEGKLQTRSWDDQQTGQKKYSTEVVGFQMTFLGKPQGNGSGGQQHAPAQNHQAPSGPPADDSAFFDDDVPF